MNMRFRLCLLVCFVLHATWNIHCATFPERRRDDVDAFDVKAHPESDAWSLCTTDAPEDPFLWPTVGNGHVATVVRSQRVFMNGLYSGRRIESKRARIPAYTSLRIDEKTLGHNNKSFCLHMDKGIFVERYLADHWSLEVLWYAHRTIHSLLVNVVRVQTDGQQGAFNINIDVNEGNASAGIDLENGTSEIPNSRYVHGRIKVPETNDSDRTAVHIYHTVVPDQIAISGNTVHNSTLRILASINPFKETAIEAYKQGLRDHEKLEELHINRWGEIWDSGRLDVSGNPGLASAAYSALYYILSSMPVDAGDVRWPFIGLSPGDLAHGPRDEEYKGHVFWDQDTWMFPAISTLHADLGKTLIQTRTRTLDAAYTMARQAGYHGTKYPWESAFTGVETCPAPDYGDYEIHVNGDIAMAAQQYLMMTRDTDLLRNGRLREEILGIADFWKSRVTYNTTSGLYEILEVMPPDEWNFPVNNSAYTNAVAKKSLLLPKFALGLIGERASLDYEKIAERMYIPLDKKRNFHPEFEGFNDNTTVKQADVILMGFPLEAEMTGEQRRNDLLIYANMTPSGPAMTWSMFCIGWLELNETTRAMDAFYKQLWNKREPFNVWSEYSDGTGAKNFITGQGGFLQSLLFGYGGLRIFQDKITLDCKPFPETGGFRISGLDYLGNSVDVICDLTHIIVTLKHRAVPLDLVLLGTMKTFRLHVNKTLTFDRQPVAIMDPNNSHLTSSAPDSAFFTYSILILILIVVLHIVLFQC